jgi:Spy/CpxP family protein refolding chaperone
MKWCTWLFSAAAVLMFTATVALAADAPPETKKPAEAKKPVLEGDLALMAKECKLSEEQQTKLATVAAEGKAAMEAWEKKNADKIEAFKKARAAAIEAKDEAAFRKAMEDVRPQIEENRALQVKYQHAIMTLLTPEQKLALQGFALSMEMIARLKGFNLTEAQSATVRTLCSQAAKEIADIKGDGEEASTAQRTILGKLELGIRDNVLTAEQKKLLAPPPEETPAVDPKKTETPAADPKKAEAEKKPAAEKK